MTGRVHLSFDDPPQDVLLQRVHQARLAQEPGVADESRPDLAHVLDQGVLLQLLLQQADLEIAAHGEWREPNRPRHLDRVAYRGDGSYPATARSACAHAPQFATAEAVAS